MDTYSTTLHHSHTSSSRLGVDDIDDSCIDDFVQWFQGYKEKSRTLQNFESK